MAKFDACIASTYATAGALVVTTQDAILHGVCIVAGVTATAGSVIVKATNSTGQTVFALTSLTSGGISNDGPYTPIVCQGGIYGSVTGTAFNYVVYYTNL